MKLKAKWIQDGRNFHLVLVKNNHIIATLVRKPFSISWIGRVEFNANEDLLHPVFVECSDFGRLQEIVARICNVKII